MLIAGVSNISFYSTFGNSSEGTEGTKDISVDGGTHLAFMRTKRELPPVAVSPVCVQDVNAGAGAGADTGTGFAGVCAKSLTPATHITNFGRTSKFHTIFCRTSKIEITCIQHVLLPLVELKRLSIHSDGD